MFPKLASVAFSKNLKENKHTLRGYVVDDKGHKALFGYTRGMHLAYALVPGIVNGKGQVDKAPIDQWHWGTLEWLGTYLENHNAIWKTYLPQRHKRLQDYAIELLQDVENATSGKQQVVGCTIKWLS